MTLHLQKNNYQSILDAFIYSIRATISDSSCDIDLPLQTNEWNLRQHIYHLIDTPSAGLHTILKEALSNPKSKVEISGYQPTAPAAKIHAWTHLEKLVL